MEALQRRRYLFCFGIRVKVETFSMIITFLLASIVTAFAASVYHSEDYHRHCRLSVTYSGTCLMINNQNLSHCPQLDNRTMKDGHILGHCDVVVDLDYDPNRVPEKIIVRKCKPECVRSCAATRYYYCTQVYEVARVNINGTATDVSLPSDCYCVKNGTHEERKRDEYREDG